MLRNFGILMLALLATVAMAGRVSAAVLTYTTGLDLWLEADQGVTTSGTSVTGWADQSGHGNNVTGTGTTAPTFLATGLNGRPTIRFDGVDDLLNNTTSNVLTSGSARTVFVVAQADSANGPGTHIHGGELITFRRSAGPGVPLMTLGQLDYDGSNWYIYSDAIAVNDQTANTPTGSAAQLATVINPFVVTYSSAGSGTVIDEWLNGNSVPVSGFNTSAETGATGFTIGSREDIGGQVWKGVISEVLVFDSVLSDDNRATVESYLEAKYLPEPASASVLVLSGLALLGRRRRV